MSEKKTPVIEGPIAGLTLSNKGLAVLRHLSAKLSGLDIYVHHSCSKGQSDVFSFDQVAAETRKLFTRYRGLIYVMPVGVVVRSIASCVSHKLSDPAIVVTDVHARWAISLLSGHEGGANRLADQVSWILDAEPIITTTSEAARNVIAGIGCRRGTSADEIITALGASLTDAGYGFNDVRLLASADIKIDEPGIREAAHRLQTGLRFISSSAIISSNRDFETSEFVKSKVNLPAVAEPSALLAGNRTCLISKKKKYKNVTIALALEHSMWSE